MPLRSRQGAPHGRTAKFVSGYFTLRDLGETRIKGLSDPLHVFELEGVGRMRTRLEVSHARGFSKFVRHQRANGVLLKLWRRKRRHGGQNL